MALVYPDRPTANGWQLLGQGLTQGGNVVDKLGSDLQEEQKNQNLLQDMVERRTAAAQERKRQEEEERRRQWEFEQKKADAATKDKTQSQLSEAMTKGVPMGDYPENLVNGVPDPMLGLNPNASTAQAYRPATQDDIIGIASQSMEPYQTAAISNKPFAAEALHNYKMDEIGARGDNARSVAEIRAAAVERAARIRSTYGRGAPKDYKTVMQDATENLSDVQNDLDALAAKKPTRAWDMQPWNMEMARLVGQKKFYQAQIYKASENGVPFPGATDGDGFDSEGSTDTDPGAPPPRVPRQAPAPTAAPSPPSGPTVSGRPLNQAVIAQAKAKFGADKNAAKAWLQSQGYDVK